MSAWIVFGGEAIPVGTSTQGPTGPTGAPGSTGPAGTGVVTNTVLALSTVVPTLAAQSTFVDGYSAQNDSGLSGNGAFSWNPTYTGPADALNVYNTGATTGAWQRQIGPDFLVNVTWFGAKGDGVTDDTAAIQACWNTCVRQGWGMYFPSLTGAAGVTTYLITKPLMLGGNSATAIQNEIRMGAGVQVTMATGVSAPATVSGLQLPNPTYGTESGLTYVELSPTNALQGCYDLTTIPSASSYNGWGNGEVATLGQSFTQPTGLGTISNVLVSSTAQYSSSFTNGVYIQGGGYYFLTVVDATHVNLQWVEAILPTDVGTGGTVANGAGISVNGFSQAGQSLSGGASAGFTFEAFVDPVSNFTNGSVLYVISSSGKLGTKYPLTNAVYVALYNDQATAQTRLKFSLTTTGGTTVINSSTHTIAAGSLTHIAATYDGISTMSLYIAGVRVATATVTGPIVQNFYELVLIGTGALNVESYPNIQVPGGLPQTVRLAGVGIHAIGKYAGSSFTPPTTVPTPISRMASVILDFAQQPTLTGPGGLNYGQGWIIATTPQLTQSTVGLPTWLVSKASQFANFTAYCMGPKLTNCNINSPYGLCLLALASLSGVLENPIFTSRVACITLTGFSYSWRMQNMNLNAGSAVVYGYAWCLGVLDGSQYCAIDGGALSGGMFDIVTNVYAGIMIRNLQVEVLVTGGILLGATGVTAPVATVRDVFFQSDVGTNLVAAQVTNSIYAYNVDGVIVEGGYAAGSLPNAPAAVIDSCGSVLMNAVWLAAATLNQSGSSSMLTLYNQTTPVEVNSQQAFYPIILNASTSNAVTNGSASSVVSSLTYQFNVFVNSYVQFANQPNTTYRIVSIVTGGSTQTWTLHTPFTGPTNGATIATVIGISWVPESGSGQGPLVVNRQESFGSNTVNMIAAAGMTLLVNDFLWGKIIFTDANSLLTAGVTITTPNIVGYQRTFINNTSKPLTISAGAGTTVSVAAGAVGRMVLLSTGWLAD